MEDTMMRKNHASLTASLAACVLLMSAASSWANDASTPPLPQPVAAASLPAPTVATPPAPILLAWDRVGIAAFGIGA
jgi:hypothetical protein